MMFERFFQKGKEQREQTQAREREREEESRKHKEAERLMVELDRNGSGLSASEIISKLEEMHESVGVALWPERGDVFSRVLERVSRGNPDKKEISRLLGMLSWPEFARFKDRQHAEKILAIAGKAPSREFIPILQQHLEWLERITQQFKPRSEIMSQEARESMYAHEISGYTPIPWRADENRFQRGVTEEARLTKDLIAACNQ